MHKVASSVMRMEEEEMLKRITGLLEQGCTMLASHHSCGAPLFRCKGQIVCPVCSFGEGEAAEDKAPEVKEGSTGPSHDKGTQEVKIPAEAAPIENAGSTIDNAAQRGLSAEEADLKKVVLRKLKELSNGIEREQDLDKLRKQFDCIEAALRALRSMER